MNYLKYIEHSAENLQFYLWFRDYCARWEQLPQSEKALSSIWTQAQQIEADASARDSVRLQKVSPEAAAVFKDTSFANGGPRVTVDKVDSFDNPSKTSEDEKQDVMSEYCSSSNDQTLASSTAHRSIADKAFADAGLRKPCKLCLYGLFV